MPAARELRVALPQATPEAKLSVHPVYTYDAATSVPPRRGAVLQPPLTRLPLAAATVNWSLCDDVSKVCVYDKHLTRNARQTLITLVISRQTRVAV